MKLTFKDKHTISPSDVCPNDAFAVKVVAVAGYANDWSAYVGLSNWPDTRIAEQGDKLTREQVGKLFHCMCVRTYRE